MFLIVSPNHFVASLSFVQQIYQRPIDIFISAHAILLNKWLRIHRVIGHFWRSILVVFQILQQGGTQYYLMAQVVSPPFLDSIIISDIFPFFLSAA